MPSPREGESQNEFHSRCMSQLVDDEGKDQDQANAICYSIWEDEKKSEHIQAYMTSTISERELIDRLYHLKKEVDTV